MDTTTATDLVELEDVTTTDSEDDGDSNALLGAACLAAGVAIGTFVVPAVTSYVKSWFVSSITPTEEQIAEAAALIDAQLEKNKAV